VLLAKARQMQFESLSIVRTKKMIKSIGLSTERRLMSVLRTETTGALSFKCPGCHYRHEVYVYPNKNRTGHTWEWNGDWQKPTFTPSILFRTAFTDPDRKNSVCHSFVTDGRIYFLSDCTHSSAGKSIDLSEIE
jgi:hypothetical protein